MTSNLAKRWQDYYNAPNPYEIRVKELEAEIDKYRSINGMKILGSDGWQLQMAFIKAQKEFAAFDHYMTNAYLDGIDPIVAKLSYTGGAA
ncbi:hypothetical protein [Rhizobium sp. 2MFCol3.1]|uniref:hypothetical protein n=1 Tax=Rhizobium sp. 2MFCol3.1 TaxID=1246459 RepID=UPI0003622EDD|nr:hypothetical protein [Rhizobium sp. 2MFCol3.1]